MVDPILSLAFSVHSNPGVYALLLGSGVSRAAGIPTGWEVVLDLVRKLAHLKGFNCEPDPAAWYTSEYQEAPDYSKLLDELAKSPAERSQLLKVYFEPTELEQEPELGVKLQTAAHKAIAELVVNGYIRVIVTTNFDRLLEMALEAVGVVPTVISTSDAIDGALPLTHTKCSIIKLHGDYLDTRIKNTPSELEQYDERLNKLLHRVFDEFGLIVCGWSAEWDTALRAAIERCPNHRFTTYWAARGEPRGAAEKLLNFRRGVRVPIQNADSFFQELAEKVLSLQEINRPHPLSAKVAAATLKKYLVESRYRIQLHDLVSQEVEKLYSGMCFDNFPLNAKVSREEFRLRVQRYEALAEIVVTIMVNGCYWGEQSHEYLWVDSLTRIANQPIVGISFFEEWRELSFYPALLLLYAGGIASLASDNYNTFVALLTTSKIKTASKEEPLVLSLHTSAVISQEHGRLLPGMEGRYAPLSDHLCEVMRKNFRELIPNDVEFKQVFDKFEYLRALVYYHLQPDEYLKYFLPLGCFAYRRAILEKIASEVQLKGETWLLIQAGLF